MNFKLYLFYTLIIGFISVVFLTESCKSKYDREDLIVKYLENNSERFNNESNFYLLTLRDFKLTCAMSAYGYNKDSLINFIADSLQNQKLYILTDDVYVISNFKKSTINQNIYFVKELYIEMEKYGFYYMPYLFQIKNNSIKRWKKLNTKKSE